MYAIRRHCAGKNAWCWRVNFGRRGKLYAKSFHDLKYGGSRKAKAAAVAWRDAQLAEVEALTMAEFHEQKRSNNTSGVPGVSFYKTERQPLGYWQARTTFHDGKRTVKSFSVRLHGYEEAYRLAVAARAEQLAMVEDRPFLHNKTAKQLSKVP